MLPNLAQTMEHSTSSEILFIEVMWGRSLKQISTPTMIFFSLIVECHILSASMEVLGMSDLDDNPSEELIPSDVHTFSKSDKTNLLSSIVNVILDTCVDISHSKGCEGSRESEETESTAVNVVQTPKKCNSDINKINLYTKKLYHWVCCMRSLRMQYMMEMDQGYSDVGSTCF